MPTRNRGWRRLEWLIFAAVAVAIVAVWIATIAFSWFERRITLERVSSQLGTTAITLADFNELAQQAAGVGLASSEQRTAAIWRALLQYPTASIWVESNGTVIAGQPPAADLADAIVAREDRANFSVFAALPQADALTDWRATVRERAVILTLASVAFLLLTYGLVRALRQRASAEQAVAAARERAEQLAAHKAELEQTVAERTHDLALSNEQLERELVDRKAAEDRLKEHDALLHAVAKSAEELLGSPSHDDAIDAVLELIGRTVGVARVHINALTTDDRGHLRSSLRFEWCAPGVPPMIDNPALQNVDVNVTLPRTVAPLLAGGLDSFFVDDLTGQFKPVLENAGMRSVLRLPIPVEGELWGSFDFIDSADHQRQWSWAETDTLQTLAGLIGAAITRARYVKELADANMIVQNSPTILYRVQGEPPFPLIYVSHNITKFGYDPDALIANPNWVEVLMHDADRDKFLTAMGRTLEKDAKGAAIEFRLRTGDGVFRWVENRYTCVRDKHGRLVEIEGIVIDITERKLAEEKIAQLARTDPLTGLANRATFIDRMRQAFAAAKRGATPFAILYIDLDHFKAINDTLGHPVGDALLREVADRLKSCTRASDVVARLGGDEFAILQTEMHEPETAGALAANVQATLTRPCRLEGNDLRVTASIGISPFTPGVAGPDAMLSQADLALYRSKEEGRNRFRFHSEDLDHQVLERAAAAEELRHAIDNGELDLYYQPQVELISGRIVGMEALVRWRHPTRGLLAASAFVPVAERTGTIIPLGQWVLEEACRKMRSWRDEGFVIDVVSINLSLAQLKDGRQLVRDVRSAIEKWRLDPADVSFDVTEATLAQVTLMRSDVLAELRGIGVRISIDDFGSEYSSFDYLRTYQVNHLKIAQAFFDAADEDPERAATVRAIIGLAHELGIGVITEGVETEAQRDRSSETSTIAQGVYFSAAVDAAEADALLRRGSIEPAPDAAPDIPEPRASQRTAK